MNLENAIEAMEDRLPGDLKVGVLRLCSEALSYRDSLRELQRGWMCKLPLGSRMPEKYPGVES